MPVDKIRLLGIPGSLRRDSNNLAMLKTLAEKMKNGIELTIYPLDSISLYNQDLDGALPPAAIVAFKDAITASDGLIVASPEFNYGIPGVLKNALDWASRPAMKSPLNGKPVLLMTSSPGIGGGIRAHAQLRETLSGCLSRVIARPQVAIASVHQKIAGGRLIDESALKFALEGIDDLCNEIRLLRGRG
jgi:chromate reductase